MHSLSHLYGKFIGNIKNGCSIYGYFVNFTFSDESGFDKNMFVWVDLRIGNVLKRLVLKMLQNALVNVSNGRLGPEF